MYLYLFVSGLESESGYVLPGSCQNPDSCKRKNRNVSAKIIISGKKYRLENMEMVVAKLHKNVLYILDENISYILGGIRRWCLLPLYCPEIPLGPWNSVSGPKSDFGPKIQFWAQNPNQDGLFAQKYTQTVGLRNGSRTRRAAPTVSGMLIVPVVYQELWSRGSWSPRNRPKTVHFLL